VYRIATIVAGVMLVGALLDLPYGYFQLLRLVVCAVAAYGAFGAYQNDASGWTVALGVIALLFNPVFPVYLDRSTWTVIDLIVAVVLWMSPRALANGEASPSSSSPGQPPYYSS
jgi:hypothetical protein